MPRLIPATGRFPGALGKRTQGQIQRAEARYGEARASGNRKLAIEVLDQLMHLHLSRASIYLPANPKAVAEHTANPNPHENETLFRYHVERAEGCASMLAPYQSATFKSITLQASATQEIARDPAATQRLIAFFDKMASTLGQSPPPNMGARLRKKRQPGDDAVVIEGVVVEE